jgi:hypothetical protein
VSVSVRFEEEADTEYRAAGRWYGTRRRGLGAEFFDEVDATIRRLLEFPLTDWRERLK